jgi:hypothetical protein
MVNSAHTYCLLLYGIFHNVGQSLQKNCVSRGYATRYTEIIMPHYAASCIGLWGADYVRHQVLTLVLATDDQLVKCR